MQKVINNAKALAEALKEKGFDLVSGGTDNHLVLLDLRNRGLTGKKAEALLDDIGVTTNKNTIPFDPESPFVTSGLRIGTPAVTTRGFVEEDMKVIAEIFDLALNESVDRDEVRAKVKGLCDKYPLYK